MSARVSWSNIFSHKLNKRFSLVSCVWQKKSGTDVTQAANYAPESYFLSFNADKMVAEQVTAHLTHRSVNPLHLDIVI